MLLDLNNSIQGSFPADLCQLSSKSVHEVCEGDLILGLAPTQLSAVELDHWRIRMNGRCWVCRRPISPRTRIYQLSIGYYYRRNETPTYENSTSVIQESHEACVTVSFDAQ